jgi:ArsR family transcriptional regulator
MLKQKLIPTIAKFHHGFSDQTRLLILETLINGEKTVSQIVNLTKQSQSNVSNHLKCLIGCGLVKNRRDGKNIIYSIRDINTKKLFVLTEKIVAKIGSEIESCQRYKNKYERK